ncbi:hypothetical protein, partial [Ralstonia pseudosolanacearum]|uniref:hypothetical protein n=1 Tax=Ralstonia pseudosolanacearum TaxID=1310165 RepID=UPI002675C570
ADSSSRHAPHDTVCLAPCPVVLAALMPEQCLILAVLCQAIADARYGENRSVQEDAERFLRGDDLAQVAGLIDLNPAFVREVAVKTGYLLAAPEELQERSAHARLQ